MNELMTVNDNGTIVNTNEFNVNALMTADNNFLSIFADGKELSEADMYNAISAPEKTVNESIGETFNLIGVICHSVQVIDSETGEVMPSPRIILFGDKGETYVSVSKTLFSSLKNLFAIMKQGLPKTGLKVQFKQSANGNKRYFSLKIVTDKK